MGKWILIVCILINSTLLILLFLYRYGFHQIQEEQKVYLPALLKLSPTFTCVDCGANPVRCVS